MMKSLKYHYASVNQLNIYLNLISLDVIACYSMAGLGLVAAPIDKALPGVILRAGIIRQPRPVAMSPFQRAWTL